VRVICLFIMKIVLKVQW